MKSYKGIIDLVKKLFDDYVQGRTFDGHRIKVIRNENNNEWYIYDHDRVTINYHGYETWRLDDYDFFVEIEIKVDGKIVYHRKD
jgi:hypothetical protein